ncbi:MAG: peptidoglycan DD-metalloendopeptidase family protein [Caldisericia bacterium]
MKKISLILVFLMLFSIVSVPMAKASYLTLEQEMEIAKRRQRESKASLENEKIRAKLLDKDYKDNLNHLTSINAEINSISIELEKIKHEIEKTNEDIIKTRSTLSKIGQSVDAKRDKATNLLKFINEISGKRFVDYVFSASDFSDLVTRRNSVNKILDAFIKIMNDLRAESHEQIVYRQNLENDEIRLGELKLKQERELDDLSSLKLKSEDVIEKIQLEVEKSEAKRKKYIDDLEKWDTEVDKIMRSIKKRNETLKATGKFIWPTNGYLSSDYGMRKHPILGVNQMHYGIDIHADSGTPIHAADSGQVYHLGCLGYYGNVIAIDHGNDDYGNNYRTLYAHLSRYATKLNTDVSVGEVIGYVGSTGRSTCPHLHFEVRVNGEKVDPKGYLKKIERYALSTFEYMGKVFS